MIKDFSVPELSSGEDGAVIDGGDGVEVGSEELLSLEGEGVSSLSGDSGD